jgi:hypothetical protein
VGVRGQIKGCDGDRGGGTEAAPLHSVGEVVAAAAEGIGNTL